MATRAKKQGRKDPLDGDFGPGARPEDAGAKRGGRRADGSAGSGPIPGLACAGDGCVFKPAADLVGKFSLRLARGHGSTLSRAASSGIEFMKALRDFLDEEIALAERAAGRGGAPRYEKIEVE
jgi:hypothetical protein